MSKLSRQWTIENGNLSDSTVNFIRNQKGKFRLIWEEHKQSRTNCQNRYYWAYLKIISSETGDDSNSLHEYFKRKHLPPQFIKALGSSIQIPSSTTRLDKFDFGKYIDAIELESGVTAPNPEDLYL